MTTETIPVTIEDAVASPDLLEQAAKQTWRVIANNPAYNGTTEGFGFTNGEAVISALPRSASCKDSLETCERAGRIDNCALHKRMMHLAALTNYVAYRSVRDPRTNRDRLEQIPGYRVLSEAQYEAEFGQQPSESVAVPDL